MNNQPTKPETDNKPLVVLPVTMADIMAQIAAENTARANLRPSNKAAVFAALAGAGIATVTVTFDGCGDSGQIESIEARDASGADVLLPEETIAIVAIVWGQSSPEPRTMSVEQAIEHLVYDALTETHGGWWSRDKALYPVAGASFPIPLAEPDVRVSKHPALHARLAPQVSLTFQRGRRTMTRTDRLRFGTCRPDHHSIHSVFVCPGWDSA